MQGLSLGFSHPQTILTTEASQQSWAAHLHFTSQNSDHSAINTDRHERELGHSDLDLTTTSSQNGADVLVFTPTKPIGDRLLPWNKTTVTLINNQGTVHSQILHSLTHELLTWSQRQGIRLRAVYLAGIENILADKLSRPNEILPTEWSLDQKTDQKTLYFNSGKGQT